jgi:hypothetical protein
MSSPLVLVYSVGKRWCAENIYGDKFYGETPDEAIDAMENNYE